MIRMPHPLLLDSDLDQLFSKLLNARKATSLSSFLASCLVCGVLPKTLSVASSPAP